MVANTTPIFPLTPDIEWAPAITTANITKDGSSGTVTLLFTAGADGAFISSVDGQALGANTASVMRLFLNNGGVTTTAANNTFLRNVGLPTTTLSEVGETLGVSLPLGMPIPAGYRLYATIGTTVAAGWQFTVIAGSY
jgi:hypothetical protein